jgi:hypothetical protein
MPAMDIEREHQAVRIATDRQRKAGKVAYIELSDNRIG